MGGSATVGERLGAAERLGTARRLGATVGAEVGALVGVEVGATVGAEVGTLVGADVGALVGAAEVGDATVSTDIRKFAKALRLFRILPALLAVADPMGKPLYVASGFDMY